MTWQPDTPAEHRLLRRAARLWGVMVSYTDINRATVKAPARTLLHLLSQLSGMDIGSAEEIEKAIEHRHTLSRQRLIPPVIVCWSGESCPIPLTLPEEESVSSLTLDWTMETGERGTVTLPLSQAKRKGRRKTGNSVLNRYHVPLPHAFPFGYHRLTVFAGNRNDTALIISAPETIRLPEDLHDRWGLFAPLYALRSEQDWGVGSLGEVKELWRWLKRHNGGFFATLPILAGQTDDHHNDPSPYSPVSKLFWNELYLDLDDAMGHYNSQTAKKRRTEEDFQTKLAQLRSEPHVNYSAVAALKKEIITLLAEDFFKNNHHESPAFAAFLTRYPDVWDYAAFRSPDSEAGQRYHVFAQYDLHRQLTTLVEEENALLYLDFPLGVNRNSLDCSHHGREFLTRCAAGAPPDNFFPSGQNWGFFPYHPHKVREQGYAHFRDAIRRHLYYTSILRIDHIMGFHRLYVVPDGIPTRDGTYIRYAPDEFYAILTLEASRRQAVIIGEDLGTVPDSVRAKMKRHNVCRMWVFQAEYEQDPGQSLETLPPSAMMSINTHDFFPFCGFLHNKDIHRYVQLGFIDKANEDAMIWKRRQQLEKWSCHFSLSPLDEGDYFRQLACNLAALPGQLLVFSLEDMWLEENAQNIPGTMTEHMNWKQKCRYTISAIAACQQLSSFLHALSVIRATVDLSTPAGNSDFRAARDTVTGTIAATSAAESTRERNPS